MNQGPLGFPGKQGLRTAVAGLFYLAGPDGTPTGSNGTLTLDRLFAIPFNLTGRWDRIDMNQLGTASSYARLGIFSDGGNRPNELLWDFGQMTMSASGVASIPINFENTERIWIAAVGQGVAPSTSRLGAPPVNRNVPTTDHYSLGFAGGAYYLDSVSGSLPKRWGSTMNTMISANAIPMVWLRSY